MTCPKCGAEPKEFWYDGSCIEHGRPEPVEGRWYYVKAEGDSETAWMVLPAKPYEDGWEFADGGVLHGGFIGHWLPIPTVEELLLTTKGKV